MEWLAFSASRSGAQAFKYRPEDPSILTEVLSGFPHSLQANSRILPQSRPRPNSFHMSPYLLFIRRYVASLKASLNETRINKYTYIDRLHLKCDGTRWRREGKWRGDWRMEWVASTLHTTSEHGVSSITTADAHTSAVSSRLNWRHHGFKWTRPFRRKAKSVFWACAITYKPASKNTDISTQLYVRRHSSPCFMICTDCTTHLWTLVWRWSNNIETCC